MQSSIVFVRVLRYKKEMAEMLQGIRYEFR